MSRPRLNILRNLRVQLKTGFLKDPPTEYDYLRRFPPLSRDSLPQSMKLKKVEVPYVELYHKAVAKNPMYLDEKVYPAFGFLEPQALVLAKRQYEYIQQGLSEEAAYRKALEYIDELENESFHQMQKIQSTLAAQGANAPFLADAEIAREILNWQDKLKITSYKELELAEQGELDRFLQMKVLKWNEVERERRMKDPVFVAQFEKVLNALFHETKEQQEKSFSLFKSEFMQNFFTLYSHDAAKLITSEPFYVEDYLELLSKAIAQPNVHQWSVEDREKFSKWIIDTVAFRDGIEGKSSHKVQKYLDYVKDQFFPMLRFPRRVRHMKPLSVEEIKAALYANEIGYKTVDGKLYVKRFYRLPFLLFPRDVLLTKLSQDEQSLSNLLDNDEKLIRELKNHGIDADLVDVKRQLADYHAELKTKSASESEEVDMSILDDILGEDKANMHQISQISAEVEEPSVIYGSPEWENLVKDRVKVPKTDLDKERHKFFSQVEMQSFETVQSTHDVEQFKQMRLENELIVRARLARQYETKEAARRVADWAKRGVWTSELPPPSVPLVSE